MKLGFDPAPEYSQYLPFYLDMKKNSIATIQSMYLDACVFHEETDEIGETSFRTYDERFIYRKEWYQSIELQFENTTIACPMHYDEVLTKAYGDWRTPIINNAVHEMAYVNTQMPYLEYIKTQRQE